MNAGSAEKFLEDFLAWLEKDRYRIHVWISGEVGWSGISDEDGKELIKEFVKERGGRFP